MEFKIDAQTTPAADIKPLITTYRPQTLGKSGSCGYSLDIADKVMDNDAYKSHGTTMDDVMQGAKQTDAGAQKDLMVVMSNTVSKEDYQKMQEDGFDATSTEVETYVSIVDKIKITLAQAGVDVAGFTDDIDVEAAKEILGNESIVNDLLKSIRLADLPINMNTIKDFNKFREEASSLEGISEDALKYMIINKKEPSVDNLYKAQFSTAKELKQASGYFGETIGNCVSFYAKKADVKSLVNLNEQIEKVIDNAGLEINDDTKEQAKWLILSGIECTKENLTALSDLESIDFPIKDEVLIDVTVEALKSGKNPKEMSLIKHESIEDKAARIQKEVFEISDEAIEKTVNENKKINIKNLSESQNFIENEKSIERHEIKGDLKTLEVRANLEEIRLMMSVEANKELIKKGIQIDIVELSSLVESLKEVVNEMKSSLYQGENVEENRERENLFNETLEKTISIKTLPIDFIGLHKDIKTFNINKLHEEGTLIKHEYEKQGKTYEEFMTKPRADLGDNIKKAFRNIEDILEDVGIEATESNKRAVRILGYNTMEVTPENIASVKEADQAVQQVIKKMNPAATLEMIREGKNPLEMSLEEINSYFEGKQEDEGHSEEKFSKFLQKLDRTNKISKEERKAYMGIYRMFRQIEKTDGAVIGNLIKQKSDINFKNMLTAVRTSNKSIDIKLDEEYGALEKLIQTNSSISGDINQAFHMQDNSMMSEAYYSEMAGEITKEMAFKSDVEDLSKLNIREETTIEGFYDDLKAMNSGSKKAEIKEDFEEYVKEVNNVKDVEETVIQKLIDLDMPISVDNVLAANELMLQRGKLFNKIFKNETNSDADDELDEAKDELIENFTDSKNAKKAYEKLISASRNKIHTLTDSSNNKIDIKAYRSICKTLAVANKFAKKESYEIPVEIDGEMTSLNLEIYHDEKKRGMISITMDTLKYGKVGASLQAKEEAVTGMMVYENKMSEKELLAIKEKIEEGIKSNFEKEVNVQISLVQTNRIDFNNFGKDKDMDSALPTRDLYKIAKSFLVAVQTKEKN